MPDVTLTMQAAQPAIEITVCSGLPIETCTFMRLPHSTTVDMLLWFAPGNIYCHSLYCVQSNHVQRGPLLQKTLECVASLQRHLQSSGGSVYCTCALSAVLGALLLSAAVCSR